MGSHFGVGAPPMLLYFSGFWDVHWGCWILTHGHVGSRKTAQGAVMPVMRRFRFLMPHLVRWISFLLRVIAQEGLVAMRCFCARLQGADLVTGAQRERHHQEGLCERKHAVATGRLVKSLVTDRLLAFGRLQLLWYCCCGCWYRCYGSGAFLSLLFLLQRRRRRSRLWWHL